MAWLIDDPDNVGYYKLYIGANGNVVGNTDSRYIFYKMTKVETINFNDVFDTSKVTSMNSMFDSFVSRSRCPALFSRMRLRPVKETAGQPLR